MGGSVQQGVALVEKCSGLIHHPRLRLGVLSKALRAGGTAICGELRAVLHAGGQQPVLVLLPSDLEGKKMPSVGGSDGCIGQGLGD